jgi:hypothetical protein
MKTTDYKMIADSCANVGKMTHGARAKLLRQAAQTIRELCATSAPESDGVTVASMGHGTVSVGDCFSEDLGEPGIVYMALDAARPIGTDTSDVYPVGSAAKNVLAFVTFSTAAAVDQTIEILQGIKAKHFDKGAVKEASGHLYTMDQMRDYAAAYHTARGNGAQTGVCTKCPKWNFDEHCCGDRILPQPAQPEQTLTYPADFTNDLQWILGLLCFQCIQYAQTLRKGGRTIPNKAEAEQAATLDWMLRRYLADPTGWRKTAADEIRAMAAAQPGEESA